MIRRPDVPDIDWVRDVPSLEDTEIKSRLSTLPINRQRDLFLALDWKQRLRIVRNSEQAAEIVKGLPEQEVLLTIKGAGEEDSLPLIALTTTPQLRFLLDVEIWAGDTVDDSKARLWLNYILSCGEQKVTEFIRGADRDLLIIMLARLVTLVPNEEGVAIPEGLPSIVPDEFFTILSNVPEETENLRLLMRILRQWDRNEFYKLLFEIHGSVDAETEEKAFRWRTSRLEEKGLLEFEEAVEIYGYIGEDEARNLASSGGVIPPGSAAEAVAPAYPVLLVDRRTFFYRLLTSIKEPSLGNRLRAEIAFGANRLLVADARNLGEISSMKAALNRLFAFINVGLLFLTGPDESEALRVLRAVPVRDLFQIGFSRVTDLKSTARGFAQRWWPQWQKEGFTFLDYPRDEVMRGVLFRVPQFYSLPAGGTVGFRDFETLDEIGWTRRMLDEIGVVAEACFDKLGIPRPHEARPELGTVFAGGIEEITFRNIIMTSFVNFAVMGRFEIAPLAPRHVRDLFERVLEGPPGDRLVREDAKTSFLSWLSETTGFDEGKRAILRDFLLAGVRNMEEEVGKVQAWQNLDPRYVATLIFSGSYGQNGR